ncbi:MAG: hypothetical protein HQ552_13220 [Desulfobacteraceae bacterium]|nr:hypothetical protein [Desulfobacteraceae bacterium]
MAVDLRWKRIQFVKSNNRHIPKSSGIYAFIVSNRDTNVPENGYIMYIGITGHKLGSKRSLKMRFTEYLSEERKEKRPLVHTMLNRWKGHIDFHYAELSPEKHDLKEIEKKLCGSLIPPCNQNDFEAELKPIVKAAWQL